MEFLTEAWDTVVDLHQSGDVLLLAGFYGIVAAVLVLVCLLVMLIRGRRMALQAAEAMHDVKDDMAALSSRIAEMEQRLEKRLDARTGDLDVRMNKKIDQKGDALQERLEQHRNNLSDAIGKGDARVSQLAEQLAACRARTDEVESRIPGLFDRLDEFRDTLSRTFQAELGGVFDSFDNSVGAILQQMKAELQMGVTRIESIEGMVRSREKAERSLLGTRGEPALPSPAGDPEESDEFELWEQEAKELAESDDSDMRPSDRTDEPAESGLQPEEDGYPAEMSVAEEDDGEDVEAELFASVLEEDDEDEGDTDEADDEEKE